MSNQPIVGLLGPEVGYTDMLDYHIMEKAAKEAAGPKKFNPLRPSSSGQCGRKLAFEFNQFRGNASYSGEVRTAAVNRLLDFGHSVEYHLLKHFQGMEALQVKYKQAVVTFFPLENGQLIEGSIDFVLWSEKHKAVGDVKSKGDKYSSWTKSKWDEDTEKLRRMKTVQTISDTAFWVDDLDAFLEELNDPFFSDNFIQLNGYANTEFLKQRGVDHAFILQYCKNDSRIREVRFRPSRTVYEKVEAKFKSVQRAIDDHQDPMLVPRDYKLGSIRCAFCPFSKECWGPAADARQDFFDTFPNKKWPQNTNRLEEAVGEKLEDLYKDYQELQDASADAEEVEARICSVLNDNKINKVRFENGDIYELKLLKNPRPHFVLRRSKI